MITIAVAKGYLWETSVKLLEKADIYFETDLAKSRKLFVVDTTGQWKLMMIRPWDVPVYVERGAADLGIVGKDVLLEKVPDVAELADLKFGKCSLVIAGTENTPTRLTHNLRVATKYPKACSKFFEDKGLNVEITTLYGAIELAPLTGLSDVICDLTATGKTLAENNLKIIETIFDSTARLIANPVSLRSAYDPIQALTKRLQHL